MSAMTWLVVGSLAAGFAGSFVGWLRAGASIAALGGSVGDPAYDFSKSWASNVTVFGAVVGTTISSKVLPASTVVLGSSNDYVAASLLFGILVVVGPLIGAAARSGKGHMGGWGFLVATAVTSWAVLGQLGTMALAFYEAERGNSLTYGAVVPIWCALGVSVAAVLWYALSTVDSALKSAKQDAARPTTQPPKPEGLEIVDDVVGAVQPSFLI